MTGVTFAAFYSRVEGCRLLAEYEHDMLLGQRVLARTNSGARYIVLTDNATAQALTKELECVVVADGALPLMRRSVDAQRRFLSEYPMNGLCVLAAPDCLAARPLDAAVPMDVGLGVTWRPSRYRINNIGYVRDVKLGIKFLDRALLHMDRMSSALLHWYGDMLAWELALGPWRHLLLTEDGNGMQVHELYPDGQRVVAYPCGTHNYFPPKGSKMKHSQNDAYLIHFKGERKERMAKYAEKYILRSAA